MLSALYLGLFPRQHLNMLSVFSVSLVGTICKCCSTVLPRYCRTHFVACQWLCLGSAIYLVRMYCCPSNPAQYKRNCRFRHWLALDNQAGNEGGDPPPARPMRRAILLGSRARPEGGRLSPAAHHMFVGKLVLNNS